MTPQDKTLRTRYNHRAIDGNNISSKCRKYINNIASECSALGHHPYKKRHDTIAETLHCSLCRKYEIQCSNKWYGHQSQALVENDKLLWNYIIRTDRVIQAHRPDVTLVDETRKKVSLINVAVLWDSKVEDKRRIKIEKCHDLQN
ncbi:uncharacterized protein [Palaemon carinicauda]|uniref:uncharacterized protein n=1 Tax=Palaemon carinicauda TaxID=392227 RepID=UPI0035B5CD4B